MIYCKPVFIFESNRLSCIFYILLNSHVFLLCNRTYGSIFMLLCIDPYKLWFIINIKIYFSFLTYLMNKICYFPHSSLKFSYYCFHIFIPALFFELSEFFNYSITRCSLFLFLPINCVTQVLYCTNNLCYDYFPLLYILWCVVLQLCLAVVT